ncbi:MAG: methyltransferase domain-containing protein [Gammaproteobacteria bacterium]|jgi:SAM-dependent methyltransferase|nr:methyltransferase domain-containing protein [Gammaproteobacteria bacterium]
MPSSARINHLHRLLCLSLLLPAATLLFAAAPAAAGEEDGPYRYGTPSRDGIGKFYMGREISHVMGHLGAGWLERSSREREERTDLLVDNLPLEEDDVVADVGAGTGYFSFRIAPSVPKGEVLAVDIQPEMLAIVRERAEEAGIDNVRGIRGSVTDPNLPDAGVDLALIVDAYHEFSHPREMALALRRALRPGGRLILVEYRAEDPSVPIKRLHKMSEAQARRELEAAGFEFVRNGDFLPQQHFLVFRRPR